MIKFRYRKPPVKEGPKAKDEKCTKSAVKVVKKDAPVLAGNLNEEERIKVFSEVARDIKEKFKDVSFGANFYFKFIFARF